MASNVSKQVSMEERYKAAMVLAGAGDALGYKGGEWEFCHSGPLIHDQLHKMGGLSNIKVKGRSWCVSDDTVMHLATAEALIDHSNKDDKEGLYSLIAEYYKGCMKDMSGRAPGITCTSMTAKLKPELENGYRISFNPRGGGCGASMRAMCIGLRYPSPADIDKLIAVSIESGRMTHHHPTGYLGALAAALFTAYSIQGKPVVEWAKELLEVLVKAKEYVENGPFGSENLNEWPYFESHWEEYIRLRDLDSGKAVFPDNYGDPEVRDRYYKKISFGGWGGASGHDSTIIAYDAILGSNGDWEELCKRGVFHGGDSDSTGTIAACCYGAMYGFKGVPENNYKKLEYRERMEDAGKELFSLVSQSGSLTENTKEGKVEEPSAAPTEPDEIEKELNEEKGKMEEKETPTEESGRREEDMETGYLPQGAATKPEEKSEDVSCDHTEIEGDQNSGENNQEERKMEDSSEKDQEEEEEEEEEEAAKTASPKTSVEQEVRESASEPVPNEPTSAGGVKPDPSSDETVEKKTEPVQETPV